MGDTYTSKLPAWVWTKYVGRSFNGITIDSNDLKYKSEQGNYSIESVAAWADGLAIVEAGATLARGDAVGFLPYSVLWE